MVRVTASVVCVETPVVLWLQCSASGIPPAYLYTHTHTHPKLSSVTYLESTHTARLDAMSVCLIRTPKNPCSTEDTITEDMIFSL